MSDDAERFYYHADDGVDYWVVAASPGRMLELLRGHGFGDECDDNMSIRCLPEEKAALVMVYPDEGKSPKIPLTAAELDSVFSTEW